MPRSHAIGGVADLLFSTLESGFKNVWIQRIRGDKSPIRREKVADIRLDGVLDLGGILDLKRKERNCRISKLIFREVNIDHEESQKKSLSNLDVDILLLFILPFFLQTYKHDLQTLKYKNKQPCKSPSS